MEDLKIMKDIIHAHNDLKELDPLFKLIEPKQMKLISENLHVLVTEKEDLLGEIGSLDFFGKSHREDFCPPFIEPMAKLAGVSTKKNSILEVQVPITLSLNDIGITADGRGDAVIAVKRKNGEKNVAYFFFLNTRVSFINMEILLNSNSVQLTKEK